MRLIRLLFPILLIFVSSPVVSQTLTASLNHDLYDRGTVLGTVLLEGFDESNVSNSAETDAMIQFFQDGSAEYDLRSLDGTSLICGGKLEFLEALEDSDWQSVKFRLVPMQAIGEACPKGGFLILSRRLDAGDTDPIKISYRPYVGVKTSLTLSGGLYLTDGVPLFQDYAVLDGPEAEQANAAEEASIEDAFDRSGYPLYDGVYVGLRDGTYVKMEALVRADSRLHFGGPFAITLPFGTLSENILPPVVRVEDIRSVFVKSPTDVVTSIQPVFDAIGILFQGGEIVPAYINVGGNDYHLELFFELFAASDCTYLPHLLNRVTISEFEYELVFDGAQLQPGHLAKAPVNKRWSAIKPVFNPGAGSKCSGKVDARGFSVTVEGPAHTGIRALAGPVRGTVFWVQFPE
jgi:hypothetical protein